MNRFTHLLVEGRSRYSNTIKPYLETHEIVDVVDGFSHLVFNYHVVPPVRIKTKPQIFILRRVESEPKAKPYITTTVRLPQKKKQSR